MSKEIISRTTDFIANFARKIGNKISGLFSRFRNKKIKVETEVKGSEKVEEVKRKVESLPKTKTVEVKVEKRGDPSNSGLTGMNPDKTAIEAPQVTKWSKLKGVFSSLRSGVNNFAEGLKNASKVFISTGGGALVLIEGFKSLVKIGQHFYNSWIDGMKEAAAMSEQNASSIREAAQANEELRQKGDEYLKQLEQLANQEDLSNANKAQAAKAIGELTKAYGDLGIKLDETTGKLTGVDSAMIKKAEKDKSRRIKELNAELKELQNANQQQAKVRDKAGIPVWFGGKYRIGGKETSEAAAKQIAENNKRISEIMRQRTELMDSDPAGELRAKKQVETARQEEEYKRRQRAFEDRKHDEAYAAETDPAKKIANRQYMLDRHNREVLDPLRKKIAAAEDRVKNTTGDDRTEARRILVQLKTEEQAAIEKSYGWQKQINDIRRRSGNAVPSPVRNPPAAMAGKTQPARAGTIRQTADKTVAVQPDGALQTLSLAQKGFKGPYLAAPDQPKKTIDLIDRSGFAGIGMISGLDKSNGQTDQNFKRVISLLQRMESGFSEFGKF